MRFFSKKKKKTSYRSALIREHRKSHKLRVKRKRSKVSKVFFDTIRIKFLARYKYIIISVLLILLVGGSIGLIFFSQVFNIAHIVVERTDIATNIAPIQQKLMPYQGKNIFFVSKDEIDYVIKKSFPEMKTIRISKLLPRTIKLKFEEYPIVAQIKAVGQENVMYLNEMGMVRSIDTKNTKLPLIEYVTEYDLQDEELLPRIAPYLAVQDRNTIMKAEEVTTILESKKIFEEQFSIPIVVVRYYPLEREIHLQTDRDFSLWIDATSPIEKQVEKIQIALADFNIYKIELAYIDLRISNKIIYCTTNSICNVYKD